MLGFVLFLSGLALLGGAVIWRRGRRADDLRPTPPVLVDAGQDLLPESGKRDADNGLATFYAYQMAAAKIHRGG